MPFSNRATLAGLVFFSALFAVGGWSLFPTELGSHVLEVTMESSVASEAKIYYNRGAGFSEAESAAQPVAPGPNRIRLPLPPGDYIQLRFDPINTEGQVTIGRARLTSPAGFTIEDFPFSSLKPVHQLQDFASTQQSRTWITTPGANDPQLDVTLPQPLRLSIDWHHRILAGRWALMGWFAGALVALCSLRVLWRQRARAWLPLWQLAHRKPRTALALTAIAVAVLSSYPVVFFGKSFMSPGTGILLLYEQNPTVPSYHGTHLDDARGADVGAMHWAHMPYTVMLGRAVWEEGVLPLWNRYNSTGVTLFGQGQSMIGDPLNFLVAIVGGNAWAFDIKFVLCKAIFALGLGWCVWLITRDLAASLIVVLAGAFVAFFNYRVNHPAIFGFSYSPWVLAGWLQIARAENNRALIRALTLWFIAGWMVLTSGTVKEAYLLFGALSVSGGVIFLLHPAPPQQKLRRIVMMTLVGVAFILATAPLWWGFLDALGKARTIYDEPRVYQTPPAMLLGLFDDLFYLEVIPGRAVYNAGANFLVLLGCLCALARPVRLALSHFAAPLFLAVLVSILIAFGWVPAAWIAELPFLRNVHHVHVQFSTIAIVHGAVLAGWGFSNSREPLAAGKRFRFVVVVTLASAALLFAYFKADPSFWTKGRGFDGWQELLAPHAFFYITALLLFLSMIALIFVAASYLRRRALSGLAATLALLAVTAIVWRHGQHLPLDNPTRLVRTPGLRADLLETTPATDFLARATAQEPARVIGTVNTLFTGFMAVYGLEGINGPDAIFNGYHRDLLDAAKWVQPNDWRAVLSPHALGSWRPLLDCFNVHFIATPVGTQLHAPHYLKAASLDLDLYRSETAWPRAFFVDHLERYETAADFIALLHQRTPGRPFAAVQSSDAHASAFAATATDPRETNVVRASHYDLSSNTTAFTVTTPGPGFAILQETGLPGDFRATLDGAPAPYFRVNHAFKAIAIPSAGSHRIAFTYWPQHFTRSLVLSAVGFALLATLLITLRLARPTDLTTVGSPSARS